MKKLMMLCVMIAVFGLGIAAALAAASDAAPSQSANDQVCPGGDSGKIDVSGNHASVTVTAPDDQLISGYCVKAGSANQGLGPEFHTVDPPAKTVTITHSSGKDVSHYSLTFVAEETPPTETTPTETTPTETTPTETTPTETTPTETTATETTPTETTSTLEEQPGVSTPPTSQDPAEAQPTVVAGVKATAARPSKAPQAVDAGASATRPSTAPQAAPFTP